MVPEAKSKDIDVNSSGGPLTLELHDNTIALSQEIANKILVTTHTDN